MIIPDIYKPIRNIGYLLSVFGAFGFWVLFAKLQDVKYIIPVWLFISSVSGFHLVLGIGLIKKNRVIFGIFKRYLKFLLVGYPLGTYMARATLKYIEEHNIESYLN